MVLNDADGDGVCDEDEIEGCFDETACNYNPDVTDVNNELREYADEYYDCKGDCLNDADGDGVCDELEIAGCTNAIACNYDELATDDDGSCAFPGDACDDGDDTTINDVYNEDANAKARWMALPRTRSRLACSRTFQWGSHIEHCGCPRRRVDASAGRLGSWFGRKKTWCCKATSWWTCQG